MSVQSLLHISALIACLVSSHAAITPVNLGFEAPTPPFPNGWSTSGFVSPSTGINSSAAAALAPNASIHQDFATTTADGLTSFTTSFNLMIDGSGPLTTDTLRIRLRGHNNESSKNLITLRLSPAGLQSFSGATWSTDAALTPQRGTIYSISITSGNLDADPNRLPDYQLSLSNGTTTTTGPIRTSWHSGTTATNTTQGTPFETLRFESGTGNTLIVDNITLPNFPTAPSTQLVLNPNFETLPFPTSWTNNAATSTTGLNGSTTAARLSFGTTSSISQSLTSNAQDFAADACFQIAGNTSEQAFRWQLNTAGTTAVDLRTTTGGILQIQSNGNWLSLSHLTNASSFAVPNNSTIKIRVIGRNFGSPSATYDICWSDPGSAILSHAATDITGFASPAPPTAPLDLIRFTHNISAANSFTIDDVTVFNHAPASPIADHSLVSPPPPPPDKVVTISGVYPHLTMTNNHDECGVGAVVPWAGKLWAITYGPHLPNGSTDKLYEISPDLSRVIRPESVGGTPANRFIHAATKQLNIGAHFIDEKGSVRTLPPSTAPGRHTGTAAHLTDPNRLYIFTMEDGVYDVDARDLSFITRYPDIQGKGDRFLFGYHGKGAYTGQGRFVVGNNGRPNNQETPTGPAGALATWDGTTVAENGGSYFTTNDPNNTSGENTINPVAAQPNYIAGWSQISKTQTCEVTGPGGIYGNPNPTTDPIWATGFDAKSVLLHVMENQQWNLWRLPKGSYSHDGSHGWHTEWPRIRQLDPANPNSIYLMHMHGIFFDFPKTFSAANFAGLKPISTYYKMPTDYAMFNGEIVMGKNDASKFSNPLAQKNQSNFWFGQMEDIKNWGAPTGHGAVWMNEAITAGQNSDPFLIEGFTQRTIHLRNLGNTPVSLEIQTSTGTPTWTPVRSIAVPAASYIHEIISDINSPWVRLKSSSATTNLTAFIHLHSPYLHTTPASAASNEFAALADIRDTRSISDGIIRVRNNNDLSLEFASTRTSSNGTASSHRYHLIGGDIALKDTTNPTAEATMRTTAATTQPFGSDKASAWVTSGSARFRLPKTDDLYDAPFAAGWARGVRETVTEREMLNCHGTFYEVPRSNSGGYRKMRALATHGKRITDFASWRGLFVLTGVLDEAPPSNQVIKNPDATAALWLGEIDDLWRMGEPRGNGGPWLATPVTANTPSDPYLMYGYDEKILTLSTTDDTTITVEIDFLADNTWSTYQNFELAANQTLTHTFPTGFHAHWVRVRSNKPTTATAQLQYGPATTRDRFLDWAREQNLPTALGRSGIITTTASDDLSPLINFLTGGAHQKIDSQPIKITSGTGNIILRDLLPGDAINSTLEFSTNLTSWNNHGATVDPDPDQSGVPIGFTRHRITPQTNTPRFFVRLKASFTTPL